MNDINIQLMDFPSRKTRECVTENEDGSYTIFIDASLSSIEATAAYEHALRHINGDDFNKEDVNKIELEAHKGGCFYE